MNEDEEIELGNLGMIFRDQESQKIAHNFFRGPHGRPLREWIQEQIQRLDSLRPLGDPRIDAYDLKSIVLGRCEGIKVLQNLIAILFLEGR